MIRMFVIIAPASRECISRFDSEEPMEHGFKATSNRTTAIPTELDGRLCRNLVGISNWKIGDVFCIKPADVRMLHATHHRRPDDVELPDVDWRGLPRSNTCLLDRCISRFDSEELKKQECEATNS